MEIRPHRQNGRFYNDPHDSILLRLKNMLKTIGLIARYRLSGKGRKEGLLGSATVIQEWTERTVPRPYSDELTITWLGHATFLIQVGGFNILTDPVFDEISRAAAGRMVPSPLQPQDLPNIDAVLISHNHRDHMDEKSLQALLSHQPHMCVPLGNRAWLKKRGFNMITEKNWWDEVTLERGGASTLTLTFLPASHWTGRGVFDTNKSLWGSWMISCNGTTVYFAGDTAYANHFKAINKRYPVIDVALMPVGPNEPRHLMYDAHVSAEEAVQGFIDLGARHFIPMHWGTFMFGFDTFKLPIQRLERSWHEQSIKLAGKHLNIVKFGQALTLDQPVVQPTSSLPSHEASL